MVSIIFYVTGYIVIYWLYLMFNAQYTIQTIGFFNSLSTINTFVSS